MLAVDGGLTMRNRVINGCCRVTQRSSVSLTTSNQYGQVDRMIGGYVNGSAGTFVQQVGGLAGGMTFKRGVKFNDIALSSGYVVFRHRIESINVLDTSGQTVTVSFKLYHDFGSTTNFKIGLRKPSATDNFTTTSTIGTDGTVAVPSGATTVVSATYTLGSTDADNGMEIVMYHDAVTVTTKNVVLGDIQYTLGSEVEQLERRSYGTELALCQRYYYRQTRVSGAQGLDYVFCMGQMWASSWQGYIAFPVTMRTAPSFNSSAASTFQYHTGGVNNQLLTSVVSTGASVDGTRLAGGTTYAATAGFASQIAAANSSTAFLEFSAEL